MTRREFWDGKGTKDERMRFIQVFEAPCCLLSGSDQCNHMGSALDGKRIRQELIKREQVKS